MRRDTVRLGLNLGFHSFVESLIYCVDFAFLRMIPAGVKLALNEEGDVSR